MMKSIFIICLTIFISFSAFCDPYDDFIDLIKKGNKYYDAAENKYKDKYFEQSLDLYNEAYDYYFEAYDVISDYSGTNEYSEYFGDMDPLYPFYKYDKCADKIDKIRDKIKEESKGKYNKYKPISVEELSKILGKKSKNDVGKCFKIGGDGLSFGFKTFCVDDNIENKYKSRKKGSFYIYYIQFDYDDFYEFILVIDDILER